MGSLTLKMGGTYFPIAVPAPLWLGFLLANGNGFLLANGSGLTTR